MHRAGLSVKFQIPGTSAFLESLPLSLSGLPPPPHSHWTQIPLIWRLLLVPPSLPSLPFLLLSSAPRTVFVTWFPLHHMAAERAGEQLSASTQKRLWCHCGPWMRATRPCIDGPAGLSVDTKGKPEGAASTQAEKMECPQIIPLLPCLLYVPPTLSSTNWIKKLFIRKRCAEHSKRLNVQLESRTSQYLQTVPRVLNKYLNTDGKSSFVMRGADAIPFSLSLKNPRT